METKIAAVTQDGRTISSHFGMAPAYHVFRVADGRILEEVERQKPHHSHHGHTDHDHPSHDAGGHMGGHVDMFAPIADCQVLLCAGMGQPAYQKAFDAGLQVVLTGGEMRAVVEAYLSGQVTSDLRRIHQH